MEKRECLSRDEAVNELVSLLLTFDAFCQEHSLRYSLYAGTLLGAVRHRGFIPWDDDLDVCMPRPDYDKLLSLAGQLPDGYGLVLPSFPGYSCPFSKFVNLGIVAQERISEGVYEGRLWMDVFPVDGAPLSEDGRRGAQSHLNILYKIATWANYGPVKGDGVFKSTIKLIARAVLSAEHFKGRMMELLDHLSRNPGYEGAENVTCYAACLKNGWTLPKKAFETTVPMSFEGRQFPAMSCWDAGLRQWYGDYMVLPPESARVTHSYKAWRID